MRLVNSTSDLSQPSSGSLLTPTFSLPLVQSLNRKRPKPYALGGRDAPHQNPPYYTLKSLMERNNHAFIDIPKLTSKAASLMRSTRSLAHILCLRSGKAQHPITVVHWALTYIMMNTQGVICLLASSSSRFTWRTKSGVTSNGSEVVGEAGEGKAATILDGAEFGVCGYLQRGRCEPSLSTLS